MALASRLLKMVESQFSALKSALSPTPTQKLRISPFPELNSHLEQLIPSLMSNSASIRTTMAAPDYPEFHEKYSVSPGVCVDPTLVVTTALNVGRLRQSQTIGGYKAYIGSTSAFTSDGRVTMKPVAVSFARDVAVLKVVESESKQTLLSACPVAASPPESENLLVALSYLEEEKMWWSCTANVRAVGHKTIPVKAPWPFNDELGWIEHDWHVFNRGPVPPSSFLYNCEEKEKVSGSMWELKGTPWFNLHGELVGLASWQLRDDKASFSVGYMAPLSSIGPVVDYAKTKGPDDPVVMDRWIDSVVITDDQRG